MVFCNVATYLSVRFKPESIQRTKKNKSLIHKITTMQKFIKIYGIALLVVTATSLVYSFINLTNI